MLGAVRIGLFAALILLVGAVSAFAANRVALVIGNDAYTALPKLEKAVNDARAVADSLKSLGYEVIAGENLVRRDMNRKLAELDRVITPGDEVFFFFAGHGVALGAENYLLPIDMPAPQPGEESLVRNEGHSADAIIREIERRGAAVSFVVLDACRDNPFTASGAGDVGLGKGLARIDAPAGSFVLFSAGIGQTALERLSDADSDTNSVFARKLVPLLGQEGLSPADLAGKVQEEVAALAASVSQVQTPAFFEGGKVDVAAAPALGKQARKFEEGPARQSPGTGQVAVLRPNAPAPPLDPPETDITGTYNVSGTNPGGEPYKGSVVIRSQGEDRYTLNWKISSGQTFSGSGSREGEVLTIYWGSNYPVVYRIGGDGILRGLWDNGAGTEVLVPRR